MRYKCLVFDHDDTVVNSTKTIHQPCFQAFLDIYRPGEKCSFEEYIRKNFDPGFLEMCMGEYGMDDELLRVETEFWREYVKSHVPTAYSGIAEIMHRHKREGGILAVVSHSFSHNIVRDYAANGLPAPDIVFGWDVPAEKRKPKPWSLEKIMRDYALEPNELLMIDDLKPGYDMARSCGVDFAAAGWAYELDFIESFMRENSDFYFKTVAELDSFLKG